jgi:hypothetical protein
VLKSLIRDIARLVIRRTIIDPLLNEVDKLLKGLPLPGGQGGGGGLGGLINTGLSFLGGIFGFADGGRPPLGRVSLVGERGPELFMPDTAGTIIPNEVLQGASLGRQNGSAIVFNFNGPVHNPEQVRRSAAQASAQLARQVAAGKRGV